MPLFRQHESDLLGSSVTDLLQYIGLYVLMQTFNSVLKLNSNCIPDRNFVACFKSGYKIKFTIFSAIFGLECSSKLTN